MATSETSICNSALIKIGVERITSIDEDIKEAILCKEQYEKLRDEVLLSHPWNFAHRRIELALDATAPAFEWSNQFVIPQNVLRVLYMYPLENTLKFIREGNRLLTNEATAKIVYIDKITDTSLFTPTFDEALAFRIAWDLAYPLVQSTQLSNLMEANYQRCLAQARSFDAQEAREANLVDDVFLNARL
jgi:hypothetical protein